MQKKTVLQVGKMKVATTGFSISQPQPFLRNGKLDRTKEPRFS